VVYVGVTGRIIVNVEALNMAESVGNVVRHKRAPIVAEKREGDKVVGYILRYLPVVSGQSIAHGYQELLAQVASHMGLPVCPLCKQGIFVKHGSDKILDRLKNMGAKYVDDLKENKKNVVAFEKIIVSNCVVEDVGGFLYPGSQPVKRTSCFYAGYMVPSIAHAHAVAIESLFHVRHDPLSSGGRAGETTGQAIYHVETGSAPYTFSLGLDVDCIGCVAGESVNNENDNAEKRRRAALIALGLLIDSLGFGAKKTRFLPSIKPESLVITVVHPYPFNPLPAHSDDYIVQTAETLNSYIALAKKSVENNQAKAKIYYYVAEDSPARNSLVSGFEKQYENVEIIEVKSASEAISKIIDEDLSLASCR